MKIHEIVTGACLCLAAAACTQEPRTAAAPLQPTARSHAEAPAAESKVRLEKPVEEVATHDPIAAPPAEDAEFGPIDVPSFDELRQKAATEITPANADAELEKLKAELTVGG